MNITRLPDGRCRHLGQVQTITYDPVRDVYEIETRAAGLLHTIEIPRARFTELYSMSLENARR